MPDTDGRMIQISKPNPPAVVAEVAPVVAGAMEFVVSDVESNGDALARIMALRSAEKQIAEYFEPARKAADSAKKEILAARDGLAGPLKEARRVYDRKADEYERAELAKAEVERKRLQALAKQQEVDRQLQDAIEAEGAGDDAGAAAIMDEATVVPEVAVVAPVAKVKGVSKRTSWSAQVVDLGALVAYVAKHPEWRSLLQVNQPNLNRLAVSQHNDLAIPGVRAIATTVRSTRG